MADIDPNAIPFVPPTDIALISKDSGKPTTAFHDWLTSLYSWMKASVVDLTTKVTTLVSDVAGAYAAITTEASIRQTQDGILATNITTVQTNVNTVAASVVTEASARSTADTALATSITTVDAKTDNATASGAVYLAAKAAPSGASAAYGWYLAAGGAFAGMEALALSGGGSAIGFTADKFYFTDSGTTQPVWTYSAGVCTFTVPIVIQSGTSGERMVFTNQLMEVFDASGQVRFQAGIIP